MLALGLLVFGASACAPAYGGAALAVALVAGVLSSHCYDYLDVTVLDPEGRKTCDATVTANLHGDRFELKSCYYAPLTDGTWTISAHRDGLRDAVSTVIVDHANDCTRHVQSMELTLGSSRPGAITAPPRALPTPEPPAPAAPQLNPPTAPEPAQQQTPAPTANSPSPVLSAVPPVGVFPDPPANAGQAK